MSEKDVKDELASRTMRLRDSVWEKFQELANNAGTTRTKLFNQWVEDAAKVRK